MSTKEVIEAAKAVRDPIYKRINADLDLLKASFRDYYGGNEFGADEFSRGRVTVYLDTIRQALGSAEIWGEDLALAKPKPVLAVVPDPDEKPLTASDILGRMNGGAP